MTEGTATPRERSLPGLLALAGGVLVLTLKLCAYAVTGSQAVFSDALESIVNVVAAGVAYALIWYGSKPADRNHPYGHGKSEFFSASFEGGLIACAAVIIALRSLHSIFVEHPLSQLAEGIAIVVVASIVNLLLGVYLLRRGRAMQSDALIASAYHLFSDFWSSGATLVGLLLVHWTGVLVIDPLIALGMGAYLAWIGFRIVRRSLGALLDEEDRELLAAFAVACNTVKVPGLIKIHAARMMRSGSYNFIDAHVVVPEFWDVLKAHGEVNRFERQLMSAFISPGEIHFHLDPCRQAHCRNCELADCGVRRSPFELRNEYTTESITAEKAEP